MGGIIRLTQQNKTNKKENLIMNREQRRRQAKEQRRPSSKKNFRIGGIQTVPIDMIVHDNNLKECDPELLELIGKTYDWKLKNDASKRIIDESISYLDSLCALRFDITPSGDKKLVRDTMHFVSDCVNMFIGLYSKHDKEQTLQKLFDEANAKGKTEIPLNVPQHEDIAPMYGDVLKLPSSKRVDDLYAECVVRHANDLAYELYDTKYADVAGDEVQIFEVLLFISKKTMQLLPEADAA